MFYKHYKLEVSAVRACMSGCVPSPTNRSKDESPFPALLHLGLFSPPAAPSRNAAYELHMLHMLHMLYLLPMGLP